MTTRSLTVVTTGDPVSENASDSLEIAALREVFLATAQLRDKLASQLGLRTSDVVALNYLDLRAALQPRDLAKHVALTSGGITGLIDRMERAGYICRCPHPTDRRGILLSLTEEGRAAIRRYFEQYVTGLNDLLEGTVGRDHVAKLLAPPNRPVDTNPRRC